MVPQAMKVALIRLTHFVDGAVNDPRPYPVPPPSVTRVGPVNCCTDADSIRAGMFLIVFAVAAALVSSPSWR